MTTSRTGNNLRPINSSNDSRNKVSHKEVRSNKWNDPTKTGAREHKTITARNSNEVVVVITGRAVEAVAEVVAAEGKSLIILGM